MSSSPAIPYSNPPCSRLTYWDTAGGVGPSPLLLSGRVSLLAIGFTVGANMLVGGPFEGQRKSFWAGTGGLEMDSPLGLLGGASDWCHNRIYGGQRSMLESVLEEGHGLGGD
ncbi:hypothetical protein Sjap_014420 [Stephania japonica]|uniref:Uncharacterized protein n=1 Tax=Stephania japonica TaxID=461633 RepID=A0AAP0II73_9MAGN